MLDCIDEETTRLIANARSDEVVERIRDAVISVDVNCFAELAVELGLSYTTLYSFKLGRTAYPSFPTLQKLLAYFAPGYEIAVAPVAASSPVCAVRLRTPAPIAVEWRPIVGHQYEGKFIGGEFAGEVRPVVASVAAE